MEKIPDKIYLQKDGDGGDEFISECATWHTYKIYDDDIEYMRPEKLRAENAELKGDLKDIVGAIVDAGDINCPPGLYGYGESVRELVKNRDALRTEAEKWRRLYMEACETPPLESDYLQTIEELQKQLAAMKAELEDIDFKLYQADKMLMEYRLGKTVTIDEKKILQSLERYQKKCESLEAELVEVKAERDALKTRIDGAVKGWICIDVNNNQASAVYYDEDECYRFLAFHVEGGKVIPVLILRDESEGK